MFYVNSAERRFHQLLALSVDFQVFATDNDQLLVVGVLTLTFRRNVLLFQCNFNVYLKVNSTSSEISAPTEYPTGCHKREDNYVGYAIHRKGAGGLIKPVKAYVAL